MLNCHHVTTFFHRDIYKLKIKIITNVSLTSASALINFKLRQVGTVIYQEMIEYVNIVIVNSLKMNRTLCFIAQNFEQKVNYTFSVNAIPLSPLYQNKTYFHSNHNLLSTYSIYLAFMIFLKRNLK
jgi:hypothetical protein